MTRVRRAYNENERSSTCRLVAMVVCNEKTCNVEDWRWGGVVGAKVVWDAMRRWNGVRGGSVGKSSLPTDLSGREAPDRSVPTKS
jgi:hypothetical protein